MDTPITRRPSSSKRRTESYWEASYLFLWQILTQGPTVFSSLKSASLNALLQISASGINRATGLIT